MNPVGKPGKTGSLMPVELALARLLEMAEASRIVERERLVVTCTSAVDPMKVVISLKCLYFVTPTRGSNNWD